MVHVHTDGSGVDLRLIGDAATVYSEITVTILRLLKWANESDTPARAKAALFTIVGGYCMNPTDDLNKYADDVTDALGTGGDDK